MSHKTRSKKGQGRIKRRTKKQTKKQITVNMNSYFKDPCLLLNNSKLLESGNAIETILNQLPEVIKMSKPTKENPDIVTYKHTDQQIIITRKKHHLSHGASSKVYEGTYNGMPVIIRTPKINTKETMYASMEETLVQNTLYCKLNSNSNSNSNSSSSSSSILNLLSVMEHPVAKIPKIVFICKENNTGYIMVGMEYIKGTTGYDFIDKTRNTKESHEEICNMIRQIASLLSVLQDMYGFMHRDLHLNNIMYTSMSDDDKMKGKQWYLIDYGMARFYPNPKQFQMTLRSKSKSKTYEYPYEAPHKFNSSHDLRILLTSMFEKLYMKVEKIRKTSSNEYHDIRIKYRDIPVPIFFQLVHYMISTILYVDKPKESNKKTYEEDILFWKMYGNVVNYKDIIFDPKEVYKTFTTTKNMWVENPKKSTLQVNIKDVKRIQTQSKSKQGLMATYLKNVFNIFS